MRMITIGGLVLALNLGAAAPAVHAQFAETKEDIIEGLTPKPEDGLRRKDGSRGLSVSRSAIGTASAAQLGPSVALRVNFGFASAELTRQARATLDQLAQALTAPELDDARFLLTGHTDASGPETFNKTLSRNRAIAAREYLVNRHGIARTRLDIDGAGESRPLVTGDPQHPDNRRVEITRLAGN